MSKVKFVYMVSELDSENTQLRARIKELEEGMDSITTLNWKDANLNSAKNIARQALAASAKSEPQ